jgi:hypothetical protein
MYVRYDSGPFCLGPGEEDLLGAHLFTSSDGTNRACHWSVGELNERAVNKLEVVF